MKLTINITGSQPPAIPIHHRNLIYGLSPLWLVSPESIRHYDRYINGFDLLFDMKPQPIIDGLGGIRILEIGRTYNAQELPMSNLPIYTVGGGLLYVGQVIPFNLIGFNLNRKHLIYIDANDPFVGAMYIKYEIYDKNGVYSVDTFKLDIVKPKVLSDKSNVKVVYTRSIDVPGGSVVPIRMNDHQIREFDYQNWGAPLSSFYDADSENIIQNHYPTVGLSHTSRIYFLKDETYDTECESSVYNDEFVLDGNLLYEGKPIYYGQSIDIDDTNSDKLILNASSLLAGTLRLYIGMEDFLSGWIYIK